MKKILLSLVMVLICASPVLALPDLMSVVDPPPEPSTGGDVCQAYAVKDTHCSGDIKIYQQCISTMSGTEWQQRSENCQSHGDDWTCQNNLCVQGSSNTIGGIDTKLILIGGLIIGGLILLTRRK